MCPLNRVNSIHTYLEEKFSEMGGIVGDALASVEARIDTRIDGVETRLDRVDERLDRIENRLIAAQERDIERLRDDMRLVKTKLGMA